jgi:transcriptional regulator with XRE-family HTH domain
MPRTTRSAVAAEQVGWEIKQTRLKLEMSQAELAPRLVVSASYVWAIEAGTVNLTVGQLSNIASGLGVGLGIGFPIPSRETLVLPETISA